MSGAGRRWLEVGARCPAAGEREALLADALLSLGGRAAEEREGWYVTHLEAPEDLEAFLARAEAALTESTGLRGIELRTRWQADEEWAETWKRGLGARAVSPRVLVRPSWIERPAGATGVDLVIDPGMAFGTAEHGTTRGCLRLLDRAVETGDRLLDVGAGSGILAIAAALLGASEVVALEADPFACEALRENVARNGVEATVRCAEGQATASDLEALGPADGVVANIQPGPLKELMPGLVGALDEAGWLILSGIRSPDWDDMVSSAVRAGMAPEGLETDEGWCSGLFVRSP